MRFDRLPISVLRTRYVPGGWDLLAFVLVFCLFVYLAEAAHGLVGSLAHLEATPISLAPSALVGYAARTALRMLIAMLASLLFTFTYATLAAKSRRAEVILVPLLDFLQSVPILSFSLTILFFLQLTPGRVAGAEMAAISAPATRPGVSRRKNSMKIEKLRIGTDCRKSSSGTSSTSARRLLAAKVA